MTKIIDSTPETASQVQTLLDKHIPHYRQAYSDRTAWLMACLSELAYLRFNPLFKDEADNAKVALATKLIHLVDGDQNDLLRKFVDQVVYDHDAEKQRLIDELHTLQMQLITTFDEEGTQAILVEHTRFIALAFRGTEVTDIHDFIADGNCANTAAVTDGKVHTGFAQAYAAVSTPIQAALDKLANNKPLFITGHSLGGALATLAAKQLHYPSGIAACYTFGSPRVGDTTWVANMPTAVYRVVNAADFVTNLPPSGVLISTLSGIVQFIPKFGEGLKQRLQCFGGYIHCGNMRYLTNCQTSDYTDVRLLYSVDLPYRIKGFLANKLRRWRKPLADHYISIYRKKLFLIAMRRNNI